jgi:hypothetical protein
MLFEVFLALTRIICLTNQTLVMLLESLLLVYTSILVSSKRRFQARCENIWKMIVKYFRKRVYFQ